MEKISFQPQRAKGFREMNLFIGCQTSVDFNSSGEPRAAQTYHSRLDDPVMVYKPPFDSKKTKKAPDCL